MDIGVLEDEGTWVQSDQLVALMEELRLAALQDLPEQGLCTPYSARLLMDALLGAVLFGGYLPPIRLAAVRTLQVRTTDYQLGFGESARVKTVPLKALHSAGAFNHQVSGHLLP